MLIVEDGTGLATAESFASVAFADDYHAKFGNVLWATLLTPAKEILLRRATAYIQGLYASSFVGVLYNQVQALAFPRVSYEYAYRNLFSLGVPRNIAEATAELALIANSASLLPNAARGKKSVKIGPISVEYDGSSSKATQFIAASIKLSPFLKAGSVNGNQVRLIRA